MPEGSTPHIVLIVLDTARADVLNLPNESEVMPHLSRLAQNGRVYSAARANAPWTLPSHGTLFSGYHPTQHGAHAANKTFTHNPTLAQQLRSSAYHTVGISNNTWISPEFGFDRGFNEFITTWKLFQDGVGFGDVAQLRSGRVAKLEGILQKFSGNPIKNVLNLVYGQYFRRRYDDGAKRTNELIGQHLESWIAKGPVFLFVNYLEPHLEYNPPDNFAREWLPSDASLNEAKSVNQDAWAYVSGAISMDDRDFELLRGLYRAELAYLDECVNDLYQLFVNAGIAEETVFLITGDHGENIGDHALMDHQYSLHETLLRVPLVALGPQFTDGTTHHTPVQLADIVPTILDVADCEIPDTLPGHSLVVSEDIPNNRPIFSEYLAPQPPIESLHQRYDCRRDVDRYDRRLRAVYRKGWKFIRGSDESKWLYDLTEGAAERTNLAQGHPQKLAKHEELLDEWTSDLPEVEQQPRDISKMTKNRLEDLGYIQ